MSNAIIIKNQVESKGCLFEQDGATWFRSTAFGDTKDRVIIKENGEFTYFMSDMAYHHDKLERGFDHLIDIWGADHHGYVKRCEASCPDRIGYRNIEIPWQLRYIKKRV